MVSSFHPLRQVFLVKQLHPCNYNSAEEIERNLIVYWSFFAENESSHQEPRNETIERPLPYKFSQEKTGSFIEENEGSKFLAVFPGVAEDGLDGLCIECFEQKGHNKRMDESHPTAVLQAIAQPFQHSQGLRSAYIHIQQLQMIRLLTNIGRGCLYRFSQQDKTPKNLSKFLKMKKNEESSQANDEPDEEKMAPHYAHRILYLQYAPLLILALPSLYFINDITNPLFLESVNLLQYYSSGLLCYNSFFTQEKVKYFYPFLTCVAVANSLTGPLSVATPLLLGALNLYAPFTDQKYHKFETVENEEKIKAYMRVQVLFYFFTMVILTLKIFHFLELHLLEKKLGEFEKKNKEFNDKFGSLV